MCSSKILELALQTLNVLAAVDNFLYLDLVHFGTVLLEVKKCLLFLLNAKFELVYPLQQRQLLGLYFF